jgi:hypothetical protein
VLPGISPLKSTNRFKVHRALEIVGIQFIDADDSGGEGVRRGGARL